MVWVAWACSGDCLSCHPALKATILTDMRHKPMLTCIACHKEEQGGISECGKDCFACHDVAKIDMKTIIEHQVINECRACHMNVPQNLSHVPSQTSQDTTILELLQGGINP